MKKLYFFPEGSLLLVLLLLLAARGTAQLTPHWIKRYAGNGGTSADGAAALALNTAGQVHVTGISGGDFVTIRHNDDGSRKWLARYNGPAGGRDEAMAIVVDGAGNVYVTGSSEGKGTGTDYVTIKYDGAGKQLWAARYNGPANDQDEPAALAVDGSGNVYVTGRSTGSTTKLDFATIKYDKNGKQLWVKRYNGPLNGYDRANALAVDASGNVYVTGGAKVDSDGSDPYDLTTIKYNTAGVQQWIDQYDDDGFDIGNALVLDEAGNVYVTGSSGFEDAGNYTTIKYSNRGGRQWLVAYHADDYDYANALAVDREGNVYVTGFSQNEADFTSAYSTVKYNASGVQQWAKQYSREPGVHRNDAQALALDGSGNVYVTGYSYNTGSENDYATVKYDRNGNQLWVERFNGTANEGDAAVALAVDGNGNVFVTGASTGAGTASDYLTIKYPPFPNKAAAPCTDKILALQ
ncbi:SBBP repeat-containing protein [Paraflavisolibacter sp. H34]|uniref:SBBP repeat-containing protein n=1 Tax=Huijunlia imazamoxiresistens TaxID=3127457 RepID=UPI003015EB6F